MRRVPSRLLQRRVPSRLVQRRVVTTPSAKGTANQSIRRSATTRLDGARDAVARVRGDDPHKVARLQQRARRRRRLARRAAVAPIGHHRVCAGGRRRPLRRPLRPTAIATTTAKHRSLRPERQHCRGARGGRGSARGDGRRRGGVGGGGASVRRVAGQRARGGRRRRHCGGGPHPAARLELARKGVRVTHRFDRDAARRVRGDVDLSSSRDVAWN